jgi:hypothetical protein
MKEDNFDYLKDILFHLELEGTFFYEDENNEKEYFIVWKLVVKTSDVEDEDLEFDIHGCIKSEFHDDDLIFTYVGANSEPNRIIGLPEIEYWEFENSVGTLLEDTNLEDSIKFLKNMRTINFNSLKSSKPDDNKNYKWVE